ncbi:YbaY family lipoprotein [Cohaesibacter intestini]|uniref:YbaY family lipoprotein n=1 Tax=Cohaesibacter intestini TaxID=2211145 RepID=UPI000DEB0FD5|nr:YbaY family lipoprotein [Cohaesibacter intestini]
MALSEQSTPKRIISDRIPCEPAIPFGPFSLPNEVDEADAILDKILNGELQGEVVTATPVALPDGAKLEVRLLDLSDIDAPVIILCNESISDIHRLPHAFSLNYNHHAIRRGNIYAISATIRVGGKLLFGNACIQLVFTSTTEAFVRLQLVPVG